MKASSFRSSILAAGAVSFALMAPAGALTRGTTEAGQAFVSGGITPDEVDTLKDERKQYSVALLTVAKGSGAYLADVHVTITDAKGVAVLDTVMDGPWLLVNLPAGRYKLVAVEGSGTQTRQIAVSATDHQQITMTFDTNDQVEKPNPQ